MKNKHGVDHCFERQWICFWLFICYSPIHCISIANEHILLQLSYEVTSYETHSFSDMHFRKNEYMWSLCASNRGRLCLWYIWMHYSTWRHNYLTHIEVCLASFEWIQKEGSNITCQRLLCRRTIWIFHIVFFSLYGTESKANRFCSSCTWNSVKDRLDNDGLLWQRIWQF